MFRFVDPPTHDDLQNLVDQVARHVTRMLARRGLLGDNLCGDGFCCNSPCSGQCEACNLKGGEGTCVPVYKAPVSPRPACEGGTQANPCAAKLCDSEVRDSCAAFVGADTPCREASCENGVATIAARGGIVAFPVLGGLHHEYRRTV
jgi:hypothetical protein